MTVTVTRARAIGLVFIAALLVAPLAVPPAAAKVPVVQGVSQPAKQPLLKRLKTNMGQLLRGVRARATRTWQRWNRLPTRQEALRPLQRMVRSGRITEAELDPVRGLYGLPARHEPQIRSSRSDPKMQPLFRLLDRGEISRDQFVRIERALGR
jgi:hypothetical protein